MSNRYFIIQNNILFSDVTPSAVHVGNIVQGHRMAWAQGRELGPLEDEGDSVRKVVQVYAISIYTVVN